jgi:hypothetical protein
MNDMIESEKRRRAQFQSVHGRVIPLDFIPGITNKPVPSVTAFNRDTESIIQKL